MSKPRPTDDEIEALIPRAAAADGAAWGALWEALEPRLLGLVRNPRVVGRLSQNEDDARGILVEVMGRLRDDDFRRLKTYLTTRAANPALTFMPWLLVVAKRVAIDYLRGHPDYVDRRRSHGEGSAPGAWVVPGTLPPDSQLGGARPPMTNRGTALEMLRYAGDALPPEQRRALDLWIRSATFAEIAEELELAGGAGAAARLVRAALERLRRHFRTGGGEG